MKSPGSEKLPGLFLRLRTTPTFEHFRSFAIVTEAA